MLRLIYLKFPQELWAVIADHDNQQVIRKKSPLFEFTDKELREIGKRWLENLLLEAAEQRGGR